MGGGGKGWLEDEGGRRSRVKGGGSGSVEVQGGWRSRVGGGAGWEEEQGGRRSRVEEQQGGRRSGVGGGAGWVLKEAELTVLTFRTASRLWAKMRVNYPASGLDGHVDRLTRWYRRMLTSAHISDVNL